MRCGPCPPGLTGDGTRNGCKRAGCANNVCYPGEKTIEIVPLFALRIMVNVT